MGKFGTVLNKASPLPFFVSPKSIITRKFCYFTFEGNHKHKTKGFFMPLLRPILYPICTSNL